MRQFWESIGTVGLCCGVALVTAYATPGVHMANASICSCSSAFCRPPSPPAACNMPRPSNRPAGGAWQIRQLNILTSAGIRRIAVRLMLALSCEVQNMNNEGSSHDKSTDELIDIRDVHVSRDLPRDKRIAEYIRQIRNPYLFKCGEITVHVSFTPNGPTLEECIAGIIR